MKMLLRIIRLLLYSFTPWLYLYFVELPLYKWFWFFGLHKLGILTYLVPLIMYFLISIVGFIAAGIIYPVYKSFCLLVKRRGIGFANWNFAFNLIVVLFFLLTNRISLGMQSGRVLNSAIGFHIFIGIILAMIIGGAIIEASTRDASRKGIISPFRLKRLFLIGIIPFLLSLAYNSPRVLSAERNLKGKPNVLIITIDTTNINYLPGYGSPDFTAPNLAEFEKESVLFEQAYASVPLTTPSHASIFTGAHPQNHGAFSNESKLPLKVKTAAEFFRDKGYMTAGFPSAFCVSAWNNFDQGFDFFVNRQKNNDLKTDIFRHLAPFKFLDGVLGLEYVEPDIPDNPDAQLTNKKFLRWVTKSKNTRWFAWIHYFDPHAPYMSPDVANNPRARYLGDVEKNLLPVSAKSLSCLFGQRYWEEEKGIKPKDLDQEDLAYIRNLYRGEIANVDKAFGEVISKLKELGIYDNTIIAVIGDHGEGLYERSYFGHNYFLNDDETRIPFIIHIPSKQAKKIGWLVESIDLYPTLIDYAGLGLPKKFAFESRNYSYGRTLHGLIEEDPNVVPYWNRPILTQVLIYSRAIRQGDWKLIWGLNKGERVFRYNCDEFRLYNMKTDPGESVNVAADNPDIVKELTGKLEDMMRELEGKKNFRAIPFKMYLETGKKDEYNQLMETLIGLGYLSGAQLEKMLSSDWSYDENASSEGTYDENCGCRGRDAGDVSIKPWELPGTNPAGV